MERGGGCGNAASLRPSPAASGAWQDRTPAFGDRYPGSRLRSGNPAAQVAVRLVLLGSPPDTVHGAALRGTDPSSLLTWVRRHNAVPGAGIHPCCSGLQVQGTANSPTSAALPRAGRIRAVPGRLVLLSYIIFARLSILAHSRRPRKAGFIIIHHFRPIINPVF